MAISIDEVAKIASLARLRLEKDKLQTFAGQINDILAYIDTLNQLDTTGVEPMYSPIGHLAPLREDVVGNDFTRDDILSCAPEDDGKYFIVPKIV